jgi:hypothetical protein
MSHRFHELSYQCNARRSIPVPTVFDPTVYYCYYYCLYFIIVATIFYYHDYKTVATNKPLRASLFPGAAELTTHLLRLINILWLPLCRINLGFTSLEDCCDPLYLWVISRAIRQAKYKLLQVLTKQEEGDAATSKDQ